MTASDTLRCRRCAALPDLTPAQRVLAHEMMEVQLQHAIFDFAHVFGWVAHHSPDTEDTKKTRDSDPGFPDLVLVRGDQMLFVECKEQHGKLRAKQIMWAEAIRELEQPTEGRVMHFVWRPSDLLNGMVEAVLRRDEP